jgi:four helix bundle protein
MMKNGYNDLHAWRVSMEVVKSIYMVTETFPPKEQFRLTDQMRRAAISVPSNIAEGFRRRTPNEFRKFLRIAFGSASELRTQSEIALVVGYLSQEHFDELEKLVDRLSALLYGLIKSQSLRKN